MASPHKDTGLKGNTWFSIAYAMSALKNYPIRNAGIALVLAIGISLPTTVFVWAASGTNMVVDDYFDETIYQLKISPLTDSQRDSEEVTIAAETAMNSPYISDFHQIPTTIGILSGNETPDWDSYLMTGFNYALGIKDTRVLVMTNDILDLWSAELDYEGAFSLSQGNVLVSQGFVDYTYECHGINVTIGSDIDIDLLRFGGRGGLSTPEALGNVTIGNLTVAGIYSPTNHVTLISQSFPSISRKNWDPMSLFNAPVLGLSDSIMILEDEIEPEDVDIILTRGFFRSPALLLPDKLGLLAAGATNIGSNLLDIKLQIEEQYENVRVIGVREIGDLETYVNTFLQSQILTLLAFPVLIMSMILTIFTSETSISRRAREIRTLRSKGASFNQVFSAFIWESLFIAIIGLVVGIGIALLMAPLIGATQGLFVFDPTIYVAYIEHFAMPPLALFIAGAIAMYLPAAYILHVARKIDVAEVGQPNEVASDQGAEESGIMRYALGMVMVFVILIVMPMMFEPIGTAAIAQILIVTLLLFVASYLGSRAMRLITARLSSGASFLVGEKSLYLSQSLRKRKGQFIPLMVILTLTLTTTSMLLIQSSSFDATLQNELEYAIGADIRIECEPKTLAFQDTIMSYAGIYKVTPVIQTWAQVGGKTFFLEGLNSIDYMDIGKFAEESFSLNDSESVLTDLNGTANGIVISEYYSNLWNKTIGDELIALVGTVDDSIQLSFEITGMVVSAPGFGAASTTDLRSNTFGSQFGFQVGQGGFALVNLDYLMNQTAIETAELFLVDAVPTANTSLMSETLETERGTHVYTPHGFDIAADFFAIQLFVSGINGITMVGFIMCIIMGLTAITLFLGSAVYEREPEYALFRAMGGSRKQVLSMAFGEFAGTIVAAIGISVILGLMFGFSMGILTFGISPFSPVIGEVLALPVFMMVIIIALESAAMIASCYFPARRASNADPATILRNL